MRVAVIGSAGQLGTDLMGALTEREHDTVSMTHATVDVTEPALVSAAINRSRPDVVVNCAAYVRVDQAEDDPVAAFQVNAVGALHVARACADAGAVCTYISTDFVFDGQNEGPYAEQDQPRPINVYGTSKLAGENLVSLACPESLIVRMGSVYGTAGASGKGGNFIETILGRAKTGSPLTVIDDIRMSPTYAHDAARGVVALLEHGVRGTWHLSNAGSCTWYEFANLALALAAPGGSLTRISSVDYPARAARPRNSALKSSRVDTPGIGPLRSWPEALEAYLVEKGHLQAERRNMPAF